MYSLLDITFWAQLLYFFTASVFFFYIPGNIFIKPLKLPILSEICISFIFGFTLWCLIGFYFGFSHITFLLPFFIIGTFLFWFKTKEKNVIKKIKSIRIPPPYLGIIFIGTMIQVFPIFLDGIKYRSIYYFCCGVPDTLYYAALNNELLKSFPPHEPGIHSVILHNYHFLSNIGIANFIKFTGLNLSSVSFQFMPLFFTFLFGLNALTLSNSLNFSKKTTIWLLFLLYFFGDIIFLIPLFTNGSFDFRITTIENASSLWISPARYFSLVVLFAGLSLFVGWVQKNKFYTGALTVITLSSLIGFKVYTAAILLAGFLPLLIFVFYKKDVQKIILVLLFYVLSFFLYAPINSGAGGLIFTGFWRFEDFIVQENLHLSNFELARQIYLSGGNLIKAYGYDLFFACLYIFFSSGILVFGFFQTKKSLSKIPFEFLLITLFGLITTCIAGFFFIQKTGGSNSSQFLLSIYAIGIIYAALGITAFLSILPRKVVLYASILIIILSASRVIHDSYIRIQNVIHLNGTIISEETYNSYLFLSSLKDDGIVITTNPLNLDCIFITFLGNKPTYVCSSGAPEDRGNNISEKINFTHNLFLKELTKKEIKELKKQGILYIYKNSEVKIAGDSNSIRKIFENKSAVIYKIN